MLVLVVFVIVGDVGGAIRWFGGQRRTPSHSEWWRHGGEFTLRAGTWSTCSGGTFSTCRVIN